mmetsp:Transcript_56139/g.174490  ORF Transcript_56139/g.174490 Transcript_56139/m.174490 type:complete len:301 (+) Transcript_56139:14-916(+)
MNCAGNQATHEASSGRTAASRSITQSNPAPLGSVAQRSAMQCRGGAARRSAYFGLRCAAVCCAAMRGRLRPPAGRWGLRRQLRADQPGPAVLERRSAVEDHALAPEGPQPPPPMDEAGSPWPAGVPLVLNGDDAARGAQLGEADLALQDEAPRSRQLPGLQRPEHAREVAELAGVLVRGVVLVGPPPLEGLGAAGVRLLPRLAAGPTSGVAARVSTGGGRIPVATGDVGAALGSRTIWQAIGRLELLVDVEGERRRGGVVNHLPADRGDQGGVDAQPAGPKEHAHRQPRQGHRALGAGAE